METIAGFLGTVASFLYAFLVMILGFFVGIFSLMLQFVQSLFSFL